MEDRDKPKRKFKFPFKWVIVGVVAAYAIVMFIVQQGSLNDVAKKRDQLSQQKAELSEKIDQLKQKEKYIGSDEYTQDIAKNKLGLVDKNADAVFKITYAGETPAPSASETAAPSAGNTEGTN